MKSPLHLPLKTTGGMASYGVLAPHTKRSQCEGAAMQNCPTAQWRMASELFQAAVERRAPPQRWGDGLAAGSCPLEIGISTGAMGRAQPPGK